MQTLLVDYLYSVRSYFILGDLLKSMEQSNQVQSMGDDTEQSLELQYFRIRILVEQGKLDQLQALLKSLMSKQNKSQELFDISGQLILFIMQNVSAIASKFDSAFIDSSLFISKRIGLKSLSKNQKYRILVCSLITLSLEEYDKFFEILHPQTDEIQLVSMKLFGYLMIHRIDLAEKELEKMANLDSSGDSAAYKLSKAFLKVRICSFFTHQISILGQIQTGRFEGLIQQLDAITQQFSYTFKLYNYILYVFICSKQSTDFKAAEKLIEGFLNQKGIQLKDPATYKDHIRNPDFRTLLVNFGRVSTLGKRQSIDKQVIYLSLDHNDRILQSLNIRDLQMERQLAGNNFDAALKQFA